MIITAHLFQAFSSARKCWLRFIGDTPTGNSDAEWIQSQNESCRADAAKQLVADAPADESALAPTAENLKSAKWTWAMDILMRTPNLQPRSSRGNEAQTSPVESDQSLLTSAATIVESHLHAIERVPSEGRGKAAQFIPIRFIFRNKLTKDDKLQASQPSGLPANADSDNEG